MHVYEIRYVMKYSIDKSKEKEMRNCVTTLLYLPTFLPIFSVRFVTHILSPFLPLSTCISSFFLCQHYRAQQTREDCILNEY